MRIWHQSLTVLGTSAPPRERVKQVLAYYGLGKYLE